MPNFRPGLAAVCLAFAATGSLFAQAASTAAARAPVDTTVDVLVVDHDFATASDEFIRVFLESGQVYRGELNSPDVTLQIRALGNRIKPPRVYSLLGPEASSGASVVEVYPDADAVYEIRAVSGAGAGTRLRLYRDIGESHRRTAILTQPGWEIGLELSTGWHSGFAQSNGTAPVTGGDPHGGTDVEGCFTARSAPGLSRLGLCAFGVGYQSQVGARSILWIFTEPRLRLVGKAARGHSNWEAGALFRMGIGEIERSTATPWIFAPGAYVARYIRTGPHASGWSVQCSYRHAIFNGFDRPLVNTGSDRPQSNHVTLGLGWYQ